MLNIIGETDKLNCRPLSCFCLHCEAQLYRECLNAKYVQPFQIRELKKNRTNVSETKLKTPVEDANEKMHAAYTSKNNLGVDEHLDQTHVNNQEYERQQFFETISRELQSATDFTDMQAKCIDISNRDQFKKYTVEIDHTVNIFTENYSVDAVAVGLLRRKNLERRKIIYQ